MKNSTKDTIDNYVINSWEPGGFVRAVLENDLMGALGRADIQNRVDIFEICQYVYNEIPAECHGSREKVLAWLTRAPDVIEAVGYSWKKMKEVNRGTH